MLIKSRKILCLAFIMLMSVVICVSSVFVAHAEGEGDVILDPNPQPVVTDPDPQPIITDPPEPVYTTAAEPEPVYTTAAPVAPDPVYTTAAPVYETEYYEEPTQYVEYSYYEPETEYQNQAEYYDTEQTEPTENTKSLYNSDSDKKFNSKELNNKNWKNIADELANSKEKDGNTSSPFNLIKNADKLTGWDAFISNLNWAITAGIVCAFLALISIIVFVFASRKAKKSKVAALSPAYSDDDSNSSAKTEYYTPKRGRASHAGSDDGDVYVPRSERSTSDYGDDYGDSVPTTVVEEAPQKSKRRVSDTAEIDLTKRRF